MLFVALIGAVVVAAQVLDPPSVTDLRRRVADAGTGAPVLFVLVFALATLVPVPKNAFSAAGGLLFGVGWGVGLVYLGAMAGATVAFYLARLLGRAAVERLTGASIARLDDALARRGFLAIVVVRLVPVLPFTAINYTAGLTGIRVRDYVAGTAVGIVPGTVTYVVLGSYADEPTGWPFRTAIAALLVFTAAGVAVSRHRRKRMAGDEERDAKGDRA